MPEKLAAMVLDGSLLVVNKNTGTQVHKKSGIRQAQQMVVSGRLWSPEACLWSSQVRQWSTEACLWSSQVRQWMPQVATGRQSLVTDLNVSLCLATDYTDLHCLIHVTNQKANGKSSQTVAVGRLAKKTGGQADVHQRTSAYIRVHQSTSEDNQSTSEGSLRTPRDRQCTRKIG
jgi:hypothetical protein